MNFRVQKLHNPCNNKFYYRAQYIQNNEWKNETVWLDSEDEAKRHLEYLNTENEEIKTVQIETQNI